MTLFLAGHETTANALSWTFYLLSQNPIEETLWHEEIDSVLGGKVPTIDDLPRLTRTEAVLAESLRLFPPAWAFGRRVGTPVSIGGVPLPVGAVASLSPYTTHRDPRWFPEPLRFDLARWTPEARGHARSSPISRLAAGRASA
jgi:cytochrome P450